MREFHTTSQPRFPKISQAIGPRRRAAWLAGLALLCIALSTATEAVTLEDERRKMGSTFGITAVHDNATVARQAIEAAWAEIDRIEAMISSWRDDSQTSEINRQAGVRPVAVSDELYRLIRRALKVSRLTEGAFDISFAGVGKLWDFLAEEPQPPAPEAINAALARVDWTKIELNDAEHTVFLREPGMRIGFGAIGKGYAANRAGLVLRDHGIDNGVVSAGGDLVAFGRRADGGPWSIGIAHPRAKGQVFARLPVHDHAVVTSGDYERFMMLDGKRHAHILDPRTGYPVDHLQSVTIVCPDAELADALATATFVLGPEKGLALIDKLRGIEALMVDMEGQVHVSNNLRAQLAIEDPSVLAKTESPKRKFPGSTPPSMSDHVSNHKGERP